MRKIQLFILVLFSTGISFAQTNSSILAIDTFESKIDLQRIENKVIFKPILRPLVQVPAGRMPYYNYLWDFGDGHFSTLAEPTHQYSKAGEFDVTLYAVNNYDDGPKPKRPKKKIKLNKTDIAIASTNKHHFEENFFSSNSIFQIFKLSDAKPGEDITLVAGVHTNGKRGKIYILSNEKIAGLDGFKYVSQSNYYNEQIDTNIIQNSLQKHWATVTQSTFTKTGSPDYGTKEMSTFHNPAQAIAYFKDLYASYNSLTAYDIEVNQGDTQFSIINLAVTEDMLVDTNAIVTITGVFIPTDGIANVHQIDIPIVKSHDPNKMSIKPARMNYRFQHKKKTMTYKVQFQNDGEGDAKNLRLEMILPDEIVKNTFKLKALYPKVDSCTNSINKGCYTISVKEDGRLVFLFKDIALPGSASKILTDKDSSKGFILFDIETNKKLRNKPFNAYSEIYFDTNPAIKTNTATTRFLKTLSPIVTAGISRTFASSNNKGIKQTFNTGYQIGIGLAPTAPYRKPYWQAELQLRYFKQKSSSDLIEHFGSIETNIDGYKTQMEYFAFQEFQNRDYLSVQLPLQIRYNLNSLLSLGAGASIRKDFNIKALESITYHSKTANSTIQTYSPTPNSIKKQHSAIQINPYIDFNIGAVYIGPAFGIRIMYDKNQKTNAGIYGIYRF